MRLSRAHFKTLREIPNEAEIPSHILLLRAGLIKKTAAGIYSYMPMGVRVIDKIEKIIREELNKKGAQEIRTSILQPGELWEESGRWAAYGPEMWRVNDRNNRGFCLGPTAEEVFTDIVRQDINSYRQLPLNIYQITDKFRDEARPRYGMMRSRNFIMKDAYSFDVDEEGLDKSYEDMYDAYSKIYTRCGLTFRPVLADNGAIGGSKSHEFTALCEYGESEIAYCTKCDMAATVEKAETKDDPIENDSLLSIEKVSTPNMKTIEEVSNFLGVPTKKMIKSLIFMKYTVDGKEDFPVVAFIRGDRELNMTKLVNALNIPEYLISFIDEAKVSLIGAVAGFTGPMGLKNCKTIVDSELLGMKNMISGANEEGYHIKNVNYERDYKGDIICDLKTLKEGDKCPICGGEIKHKKGVEVGQVFKLGTKYSVPMNCVYKDEEGNDKPMVMGCYGIGVSRTFQAIIDMDNNHDDNGIIWPMSVAPYHVIITLVNPKDEVQSKVANEIYEKLQDSNVEVALDDRDERPGVKFKDADLIGIPVRITVGKRAGEGIVEYKLRRDLEKEELTVSDAINKAIEIVNKERDGR